MSRYLLLFFLMLSAASISAQTCNDLPGTVWRIDNLSAIGGFPVTVFGNPAVKEFRGEKVLEFDGIDDGIIVNGFPLNKEKSFTIEIVFRPDHAWPDNTEQRFLHFQKPGRESRRGLVELRLNEKNEWFIDTHIRADSASLTCLAKEFPHPVGEWYHVAFVYANGVVAHYVNGVKEMSGQVSYIPVDSGAVSLGMRMNHKSFFKGAIHSVRMTPSPLTPATFTTDAFALNLPEPARKIIYSDDFSRKNENWIAEFEQPSLSSLSWKNGQLDIRASGGATVWYKEKISGDMEITYDVTVVDSGGSTDRVSDLNVFWMATDSTKENPFGRNGKFSTYDDLSLYYAGIGGNENATSRFRKYNHNAGKPVLQEYADKSHLLEGNRKYSVKIVVRGNRTLLYRNNELFFDYTDRNILREGYFGFRTTRSHQQIDNVVITAVSRTPVFIDQKQWKELRASQPRSLFAEADSLLAMKPLSVMDKTQIPPSGDKHDFMSMGPYWWPDSSKPNGLPYIRRDGRRNPEYNSFSDQDYFERTIDAVDRLALAYSLSTNPRYAAKAAELLRVWFINAETKMNPNLNHAQFIPGINTGRGIGIIETRNIHAILDAVYQLEVSSEWKLEDRTQMERWFSEYYSWLTTHPYGIDESKEKNNHGTWYDVQVVSISLFLGRTDAARQYLEEAKIKRISAQIEADGEQPLELARTNSWNYSGMNLSGFFHLAILGDAAGVDLWNYTDTKGASIKKALDYLLPFAADMSAWKHQQIGKIEMETIHSLLLIAQKHYDAKEYAGWMKKIFPH